MASKEIMLCIKPGEHGSTYGGNPLGCAVAITALEVLEREDLANRSQRLGEIFRQGLKDLNSPFIKIIRGRGLFNGVVIDESQSTKKRTAWQLCLLMQSKGYVKLFAGEEKRIKLIVLDYWPSLRMSTCRSWSKNG
jgi:ornithine--oxo-acid transaminase